MGRIVEVGRLDGDFAGADPAGRHLAFRRQGVLTVYDAHDALTSVASWRVDQQIFGELTVHPDGRAVAALTGNNGALGLWQAGHDEPRRDHESRDAGWLRYSSDGSCLYFGEAIRDEPARVNLLDPATLGRLDSISPIGVHAWDEPIGDWGEDLDSCNAPSPSTAVAFAANAGDDLIVFGVAEAAGGELRLHSGRSKESWADIPGERGMAMAFLAEDELAVLDSDECVSRVRWNDGPMAVTALAQGGDLLDPDVGTDLESAATLRALVDEDADQTLMLVGPMFAQADLLAIAVERETWASGRTSWETVALVVVDARSGERRAVLELAEAEETHFSNGTICRRIGSTTHVSRWIVP